MLEDSSAELESRIGQRIKVLRLAQDLSLDGLAARAGVSRSMISLIERAQASATAVVLDKLATALGVTLASLFDADPAREASPLARRGAQGWWRDPATGYERRNVSPPLDALPFQIVEVRLPPGARVAYETGPRAEPVPQQVWVQSGRLNLQWGAEAFELGAGDCLAMALDRPVAFHNPDAPPAPPAHYAVVLGVPSPKLRRRPTP